MWTLETKDTTDCMAQKINLIDLMFLVRMMITFLADNRLLHVNRGGNRWELITGNTEPMIPTVEQKRRIYWNWLSEIVVSVIWLI